MAIPPPFFIGLVLFRNADADALSPLLFRIEFHLPLLGFNSDDAFFLFLPPLRAFRPISATSDFFPARNPPPQKKGWIAFSCKGTPPSFKKILFLPAAR